MPIYGRIQVPERLSALANLHYRTECSLGTAHHEPPIGVLDQEDLLAQGIHTSQFIPKAKDVDALGSCTANATMSALSVILPQQRFLSLSRASSYDDVVTIEEAAIEWYHDETMLTGHAGQEWPPNDAGSSGPYIFDLAKQYGLASTERIAHGADNIVSLLQSGGVLTGSPWFKAWEEPGPHGFLDGNGKNGVQEALRSGTVGGHETYWWGIDELALTATGAVTAERTIIVARNSWSKSWGDEGNYRVHLATFAALGNYCDHRQLVA